MDIKKELEDNIISIDKISMDMKNGPLPFYPSKFVTTVLDTISAQLREIYVELPDNE